jgi:DNA-binding IclR family transcriptional regulator
LGKVFEKLLELPSGAEENSDRQFVTALARGLEVLRAFQPGDGLLGNQELAERTKLPKPTISRLTHTLTLLGYLEYSSRHEKYALGTPVLALGYAFLSNIGIRKTAKPHMQELADAVGASVALGNRDRLQMTYIELAHGSSTVALRLDVGARIPIQKSALGMAFLYGLPSSERDFLLQAIQRAEGANWAKVKKRINTAFKEIDKDGFCVSLGTFERTINGVGAPLVIGNGSSVYSFNCSGPAFQLTEARLREEVGPRLVHTVRNIASEALHQGNNP